jgi:hypothetical protein
MKQINSVLEQHMEDTTKFSQAHLQAMDTVIAYTNAISNVLREKPKEIKEKVKTDSLEFHDGHANHAFS